MQDLKSRFLDPLVHWFDGGDPIIILTALADVFFMKSIDCMHSIGFDGILSHAMEVLCHSGS